MKYLKIEHCGQCPYFAHEQYTLTRDKKIGKEFINQHHCRLTGDWIGEHKLTTKEEKEDFNHYVYLYNRTCKLIEKI